MNLWPCRQFCCVVSTDKACIRWQLTTRLISPSVNWVAWCPMCCQIDENSSITRSSFALYQQVPVLNSVFFKHTHLKKKEFRMWPSMCCCSYKNNNNTVSNVATPSLQHQCELVIVKQSRLSAMHLTFLCNKTSDCSCSEYDFKRLKLQSRNRH